MSSYKKLFYKHAVKIQDFEYEDMIRGLEDDAQESGYDFYDHNTIYRDVTLFCLLDCLDGMTDEQFEMTFNVYHPSRLYIIMSGKKVDSYAALIVG